MEVIKNQGTKKLLRNYSNAYVVAQVENGTQFGAGAMSQETRRSRCLRKERFQAVRHQKQQNHRPQWAQHDCRKRNNVSIFDPN